MIRLGVNIDHVATVRQARRISEPDPAWDGSYATMVDPASDASEPLAIVEFERCYSHRFGGPNDEVLEGHPLYGRGLDAYRAHEVINSRWLAAEQAINSVHHWYRPEAWTTRKHYLLAFHDECFECLAEGTQRPAGNVRRPTGG